MGITTVVVVVVEAVATGAAATGHHPLTITRVGLGGGMIDMIGPDLVPILQVSFYAFQCCHIILPNL